MARTGTVRGRLSTKGRAHTLTRRDRARLMRVVVNNVTEGIVVADLRGHLLLFNDSAARMLGLGPMPIESSEWSAAYGCYRTEGDEVYPASDLPLARALRGESTSEEEVFIRNAKRPAGAWISVNGAPLRGRRGETIGGVITFRDVTSKKTTDKAHRESLRQLEELKYAVDEAAIISLTDRSGSILYANDRFCEVSGRSREELRGCSYKIVGSGQHTDAYFAGMWQTIAAGRVWRGEICNRGRDGTLFWLNTTIVPLLDEQGQPERYLAIGSDITEHVKQEALVRRLSSAVEQTADSIFITDRSGVIEYVNPAFETTTGYAAGEVIGQTPRVLKSGRQAPAYYETLWKTILAGQVFRSSSVNRTKSGAEFHAEQTITPLKDLNGEVTHFVSVVKDVTERIRQQERQIEMEYAARVQGRLYPQAPPATPAFDIAGAVWPAEMTGGDYFDYLQMPGNALGIAIGDVCGHGLASALIMAVTRAYLRPLATLHDDPGTILTRVNPFLHTDLQDDRQFVTLFLARLDPSRPALVYASAGHPPAFVLDRTGAVKATLHATGCPLGLFDGSGYATSESLMLEPGDVLALLTDGVTEAEAPDGRVFGTAGALQVIGAHREEPARDIVRRLRDAVRDFSGQATQPDDVTIVICKIRQP